MRLPRITGGPCIRQTCSTPVPVVSAGGPLLLPRQAQMLMISGLSGSRMSIVQMTFSFSPRPAPAAARAGAPCRCRSGAAR